MKKIMFLSLRWVLLLGVILVAASGLVFPASAMEMVEGGIVPQGTTIDDDVLLKGNNPRVDGTVNGLVLAAAQSVTINGTVNGDALLFAEYVFINGTVNGNLITAATTINVKGKIGGTIIGAGGTLRLMDGAQVERNLIYGGYDLQIYPQAVVTRDLHTAAYQTLLEGEIQSDAIIYGGAIDMTGRIGGNAHFEVGQPGTEIDALGVAFVSGQPSLPPQRLQGLRIEAEASIGGTLTYVSPTREGNQILGSLQNPAVFRTPQPEGNAYAPGRSGTRIFQLPSYNQSVGDWLLEWLRSAVTLVLLGLLFAWMLPGLYSRARQQLAVRPWRSLGMGFLWMLLFVPAMLVLLVALVLLVSFFLVVTLSYLGLLAGGVGLLAWSNLLVVFILAATFGAQLLAVYWLGRMILRMFAVHVSEHRYWPLLPGALAYAFLAALPYIGWIVGWAAALFGLGAFFYAWKYRKA